MLRYVRGAAHWAGRHAFPVIAATVIAVGAAGGGIGYAVASQHPQAATSTTPSAGTTAPPAAAGHRATASARLFQRALSLIAAQTGQSVAAVRSGLAAGRSVDDIAGAKAPAIESAILAQVTKVADGAVTAGKISSTEEASLLAAAKTKLDALMAEPGTQLIADAQNALNFLHAHPGKPTAPTPSPAT